MNRDLTTGADPEGPEVTQPGVVYWITGLAGAGKTTVARLFAERLRGLGRTIVFLDGDVLRARILPDAGYSPAERLELAHRYSRLCGMLADQAVDVVCATISLFPEIWERNRRSFSDYREVLVRAPLEVRMARKPGVYSDTEASAAMAEPPQPHIALENDGARTPAELVDELVERLGAGSSQSNA